LNWRRQPGPWSSWTEPRPRRTCASPASFKGTTFNDVPYKFEAGTPNIAGAIGLGAAVAYLEALDFDAAAAHEHDLMLYATQRLASVDGLKPIGTARHKTAVHSFVMDDAHPHDVGTILDQQGIAVRSGHHCTQPLMERFDLAATVRASLAFYNTREEVDALVGGLEQVQEVFG
jgi:cysteine desulfurase/selenocysteine lyase